MVDAELKQKLVKDLEKGTPIYLACSRTGVSRATFYRWRHTDGNFSKQVKKALKEGRENMCDIAEHALMLSVKDKKIEAIKYVLSHNSPRYLPREEINYLMLNKTRLLYKNVCELSNKALTLLQNAKYNREMDQEFFEEIKEEMEKLEALKASMGMGNLSGKNGYFTYDKEV